MGASGANLNPSARAHAAKEKNCINQRRVRAPTTAGATQMAADEIIVLLTALRSTAASPIVALAASREHATRLLFCYKCTMTSNNLRDNF
jgi:hypothetical protein